MKTRIIKRFATFACLFAAIAITAGCTTTSKKVSESEGMGSRRTFKSDYFTTWMATRGAIAYNDFRDLDINREGGTIVAKQDIGLLSFGVDLGVWVRPLGPSLTSVEVYSRHILMPGLPAQVDKPILDTIATLLDQ